MHVLLYRSRARPGLLASDLNDIIAAAEARNAAVGVTGLLLYGRMEAIPGVPGEFVQWLEGPEAAVEGLFADIEGDRRHTNVEVLARGSRGDVEAAAHASASGSDGRLFPDWAMRLVRLAELPATPGGFLDFAAEWDPLDAAA